MQNTIIHGDCLEVMKIIPDCSIDMVLCDLPYGTTACKWDCVIPFEDLWTQYKRICTGAIVLTGTEPFSSFLRTSNIGNFKYDWIWNKVHAVGFQVAKYRPMQQHENISVFCYGKIPYFPIMVDRPKMRESKLYGNSEVCPLATVKFVDRKYTQWYPKSIIIESGADHSKILHPTQKPVALFEYLIRTYTNEGDTVLDNCIGSGTTAIACINTGRNYIGIEKEEKYCRIAEERIHALRRPPQDTAEAGSTCV
jgi:site-specific DNA-methyltransferase (adenine-specific)